MIPTMILVGLLLGRTWWLALSAAAVLWGILLLTTGATRLDANLAAGIGLAAANAAVGVLIHQFVLHVTRQLIRRNRPLKRPLMPRGGSAKPS